MSKTVENIKSIEDELRDTESLINVAHGFSLINLRKQRDKLLVRRQELILSLANSCENIDEANRKEN